MALTRKYLAALGIEADKVDEIISAHSESVEALKEQRDAIKSEAEGRMADLQKKFDETVGRLAEANKQIDAYKANETKYQETSSELSKLKESIEKDGTYKQKYETIKGEYETYKNAQSEKEAKAQKANAYRNLLLNAGVSNKRVDAVMKVSDISNIELDEEGNIKNADELTKTVKTEWADFIEQKSVEGAKTPTPPQNNGGTKMTKEQILAIQDTAERQKAIAENLDAFQN